MPCLSGRALGEARCVPAELMGDLDRGADHDRQIDSMQRETTARQTPGVDGVDLRTIRHAAPTTVAALRVARSGSDRAPELIGRLPQEQPAFNPGGAGTNAPDGNRGQ